MGRDYYGDDDTDQYELSEDQIEMQELLEDQERMNDLEIPEVRWEEDIERIPDLDLKFEEIQKAEKFIAEKKALDDRLENGEISLGAYDSILRPKIRKATTRCGLASVGLTYDDLGDISEDYDLLTTGSLKLTKLKDQIKETIEDLGPDAAEDLTDNMLEEERLGREAYDLIKRQSRLKREACKK
jgi:hypothetical protein